MNLSIKNNKRLFIHSILFCLSFVFFLILLLYPNVMVAEDSTKMGLLIFSGYHLLAIFSAFESVVSIFIWLGISILPLALFLIVLCIWLKIYYSFLKKTKQSNFQNYYFIKSVMLFLYSAFYFWIYLFLKEQMMEIWIVLSMGNYLYIF